MPPASVNVGAEMFPPMEAGFPSTMSFETTLPIAPPATDTVALSSTASTMTGSGSTTIATVAVSQAAGSYRRQIS